MVNVLIADNQTLTQEGVKAVLSNIIDINIVGTAKSSVELEQMAATFKPRVIIIDHNYNHRFGIQDIKNIYSRFDFAHVLVLSNKQNRNDILKVIDLGVKNFVFKECSREELVRAVYTASKGEQFYCKNTFEILFGNKLIPEKADTISLSSREAELIQLVAEGMTNKEIAEKLFLSIHTVKTHRKNIIKKLGFTFKNTAEFASFIQSNNII